VDKHIQKQLIELNNQFYQTFAQYFSDTRQRLQPGVKRIIDRLPPEISLLDLGCGNGELVCELIRKGYTGRYVGIDSSQALLSIASRFVEECHSAKSQMEVKFIHADLSSPKWNLVLKEQLFDYVVAFAVLHHLPGFDLRNGVIQDIRDLLSYGGQFVHSEWQFLNSARLRERIQPWRTIGIGEEDVEPGDYLLDWRHGGRGLRYVHHFDEHELAQLATENGFRVVETFLSDGEGGNLGLYQIWELALLPSR